MPAIKLFINRVKHFILRWFTPVSFLTADCPKYGLKFRFHVHDIIGRDIYYKRGVYYEDFLTEFLLKRLGLKDEDLVLDIGASIGWFSLVLSTAARPRVYAFEPSAQTFRLLSENILLNDKGNVIPVNLAVDSASGRKPFFLYKDCNQGRHSLIKAPKHVSSVEVACVSLDDFVSRNALEGKAIKLVKIDTEGSELRILKGAEKTLPRVANILSEFTPALVSRGGGDPSEYAAILRRHGFKGYEVSAQGTLSEADLGLILAAPAKARNIFWTRD
ncbi:MAG TPA: FkbM family methyltransferase [Elusimicrobiales bacterium]|nr:FkbM family methyltransferase [Elusimicrobiales bacterium]